MINLVKADLYKESRKKRLYFVFILFCLFSVCFLYFVSKNLSSTRVFEPLDNNLELNLFNSETDINLSRYYKYSDSVIVSKEILSETMYSKTRDIVSNSMPLYYLLGLVFTFFAYHSFSYEYMRGTTAWIFLSKYKRKDILISKVISLVIMLIIFVSVLNLLNMVFSSVFGNDNILLLTKTIYLNSRFIDVPLVFYLLFKSFIYMIPIIFMIVFSLMLTIYFKGKSISLFICVFSYLFSNSIMHYLIKKNYTFVSMLPFGYIDFTYFEGNYYLLNNAIYNIDISLNKGILVLMFYFVLFSFLSVKFINRDV